MSDDAEERREEREREGDIGVEDDAIGGDADVVEEPSLETQLGESADRIETEEDRRRTQGLGTLTNAFEQSQQALGNLIDPDALFSRVSDAVGSRGRHGVEAIRNSLSGRGLSAGSGAAQGLLSRLAFSQEGSLRGAQRDVALENQRQRQVNAGVNFANATRLAAAQGGPVSGVKHDTLTTLLEGEIAREGIAAGVGAQRSASRDNKMGSLGGGLLGLAGSVFGK